MSGWTVPESSSPPSTPPKNTVNFANNPNPSTTPAGPAPSTAASFTPAGPPPATIFGSSQLGSRIDLFSSEPRFGSPSGSQASPARPRTSNLLGKNSKSLNPQSNFVSRADGNEKPATSSFRYPGSSPPGYAGDQGSRENENGYSSAEEGWISEGSQEDGMEVDLSANIQLNVTGSRSSPKQRGHNSSGGLLGSMLSDSMFEHQSLGNLANSRNGEGISAKIPSRSRNQAFRKKESPLPSIAKDIARRHGPAILTEPDNLILDSEDILAGLEFGLSVTPEERSKLTEAALSTVPDALCRLWQSCSEKEAKASSNDYTVGIGPSEHAPLWCKAAFVGTLLLQLHHPQPAQEQQGSMKSNSLSPIPSNSMQTFQDPSRRMAFPKFLFTWLERYHNPYAQAMANLLSQNLNPTAHENFWDVVFSCAIRGDISTVLRIFRKADFAKAHGARENERDENKYSDMQLKSCERVINRAILTLESCPSIQYGDWDITGSDWKLFRKRVKGSVHDLSTFAEGRDRDQEFAEPNFEAPNFGLSNPDMSLSRSTRRAESRVPWMIYQNLKAMYNILLGGTTEIMLLAQDWVEASIGLTAWWDGDDNSEIALGSLATSRQSLRQPQSRAPRSVDIDTNAAYLQRLSYAFGRVIDDADEGAFQINPTNPVEVGLASVFEGNIEGVIGLMRTWSLPITSAVAQVASLGGWFVESAVIGAVDGFNESDLMVLSYGGPTEKALSKDDMLIQYAEALLERRFPDPEPDVTLEGWELSMAVLARLDDADLSKREMTAMIRRLPLDSDQRADKLIDECTTYGMPGEAYRISEEYANNISKSSDRYGAALIYYARAQNRKKSKDVLDLLISISLVQSLAYPPTPNLDRSLKKFVSSPRESLQAIAVVDVDAAQLLHSLISGYATLRKFYNLRDEDLTLPDGQKRLSLRPIARRKAAAAALIAIINSAADNIRGGLYDEHSEAVVPVDGLLTLLGEALVFVDQDQQRLLSMAQIVTLLRAIEDLQTVTARVYAQCEDCFRSAIAAAQGDSRPAPSPFPPPRSLLTKDTSSMSASSGGFLSLAGSEVMARSLNDGTVGGGQTSTESSSGVLVPSVSVEKAQRGWDWRTAFAGSGVEVRGEDVLRKLRLGLARDVARAYLDGEE